MIIIFAPPTLSIQAKAVAHNDYKQPCNTCSKQPSTTREGY